MYLSDCMRGEWGASYKGKPLSEGFDLATAYVSAHSVIRSIFIRFFYLLLNYYLDTDFVLVSAGLENVYFMSVVH